MLCNGLTHNIRDYEVAYIPLTLVLVFDVLSAQEERVFAIPNRPSDRHTRVLRGNGLIESTCHDTRLLSRYLHCLPRCRSLLREQDRPTLSAEEDSPMSAVQRSRINSERSH